MFSRSHSEGEARSADRAGRRASALPPPSIIGPDMRITGDIRTQGDVQVDGTVDGDVESATLTIGKGAEVNGEIVADKVLVLGRVSGRIQGRDVTLADTAEVYADITHENLEISRGATVEGMVKRVSKRDEPAPKVSLVVSDGETATGNAGSP